MPCINSQYRTITRLACKSTYVLPNPLRSKHSHSPRTSWIKCVFFDFLSSLPRVGISTFAFSRMRVNRINAIEWWYFFSSQIPAKRWIPMHYRWMCLLIESKLTISADFVFSISEIGLYLFVFSLWRTVHMQANTIQWYYNLVSNSERKL